VRPFVIGGQLADGLDVTVEEISERTLRRIARPVCEPRSSP